MDKKLVI